MTLKEIRDRAAAAHPGPWTWRGNVDTRNIYLSYTKPGLGWTSVMDFSRWGMQSARPRFLTEGFWMKDADELAVFEVCRDAKSRADSRVYRGDIVGFRHPDAEFIAAARQDVDDLLAIIDELQERERVVAKFIAKRDEYIQVLKQCVDADADYHRWQGHAEARRQLASSLGEAPVGAAETVQVAGGAS